MNRTSPARFRWLLPALAVACAAPGAAAQTKAAFGKTADGKAVDVYTLSNRNGMTAKIITLGATVTELHVPDKSGKTADVVLGFDDVAGYRSERNQYFGCATGRVANRIGGAKFTLDGKEYKLAANNGPHSLHGGKKGFDKVVWKAEARDTADGPALVLTYVSPDGEEGYPGTLRVRVRYRLEGDALRIDYRAVTDAPTVVNLTNHSYFNLAGSGDVRGHVVRIDADRYLPVDEGKIPVGDPAPVAGTPFDFTAPTEVGARLEGRYDHCFVLRGGATVTDPGSGRSMEVTTTEPGVQFY
ncbi:MAG TPA: aldose epimerase family protein, partial [Gemmataceae bacterium]